MRFVLLIVLLVVLGYSLTLVLMNTVEAPVNLIFTQIPAMNLGVLLIISLVLGIALGLLLGLQLFRVFQMRWEISRLNKELEQARARHIQAATAAAAAAAQKPVPLVAQPQKGEPLDQDPTP